MILDNARLTGGDKLLPGEFHSVEDLLLKGDALLQNEDVSGADDLYRFALQKGKLLEAEIAAEKKRVAEEERRQAEEAMREQMRLKVRQDEEQLRKFEEEASHKVLTFGKEQPKKEHPQPQHLPTHHTVKLGETLPQIASLPEVYNETALWPLLYRANRDQIRDPKRIWPGQVLRIPRNVSKEEVAEARRYSQEKSRR